MVPCCGLINEGRCAAQHAGRVQALQLSTDVARRWPPLPAMQITHAQLDALAAFYGVEFGVPGERTFCRYLCRPADAHAVHGCGVPLGLSHAGCCGNACMLRHPGGWGTPCAHRMPLPVWLHLQVVCSGAKPSQTSSPRTRSLGWTLVSLYTTHRWMRMYESLPKCRYHRVRKAPAAARVRPGPRGSNQPAASLFTTTSLFPVLDSLPA